ncbi:MAG: nickel pincer cofactor biosynthesis protein LarB [Clostridiales bacterium]|nr:nickel pincer cofactor biosynthesis protein LarB [Clostridiales bacterium]
MNGFEELDFAKLDTSREERTGFPEVVFCSGKTDEQLKEIYKRLLSENGSVFGTRALASQYEAVKDVIPDIVYDKDSKVLYKGRGDFVSPIGKIAVVTAGTSDIPVAEEAAKTAEFFGGNVLRVYDVGVAGLHRLMARMDEIRTANVIVAVAGMEGALPSVIGGLVKVPVIAVPTSVGYGASFEGLTALLSMMNSCANGISVVNIDNGYGAGYIATQINRLAVKGKE